MATMNMVGVDEVGRGCWAGPVVAGAVILPIDFNVDASSPWRLADSKLLTRLARQRADEGIRQVAISFALGWVGAGEVDDIGLGRAVGLAMRRAVAGLAVDYDEIVIDGNINFLPDLTGSRSQIKADMTVPAVSAASILAKVARDRYMIDAAERFPGYGFESHVGYGTRQHAEALQLHGPCALHRRSFRPVRRIC